MWIPGPCAAGPEHFVAGRKVCDESGAGEQAKLRSAEWSASSHCYCRFKSEDPQTWLRGDKVPQKCFFCRNMELHGPQEALTVEIQCHQVNNHRVAVG